MKTLTTNKKFYNKWLYKVSFNAPYSNLFRIYDFDKIKKLCDSDQDDMLRWLSASVKSHKDQILPLIDYLETVDPKAWTKRIETRQIDFYTNEPSIYEDLSEKFYDQVIHRSAPSGQTLESKTILTPKLPHGKYQFRVYLQPHKLKNDPDGKQKYINWLIGQSPRITCTDAVQGWFMKTEWNWDRRYVLVEDEGTLLMLKLRNPEVMGSVYNYVLSDK
jgi:hypothetical protein